MCTVSWIRGDAGYQLFFNRDEKFKRKRALPPRLEERDSVKFLAPVDPDFGGTWIAANELGMTVCLLNGANLTGAAAPDQVAARSRGLLLAELMPCSSMDALVKHVLGADLSGFAPFTLAALEPDQPAALMEWDGSQKTVRSQDERCFMLTSSSFETGLVRAGREEQFRKLLAAHPDAEMLTAFHKSHVPSRSAYSTCMHRPDAQTVSFSRIHVGQREVEFHYSPAAPCEQLPGETLVLARRQISGAESA
jgi:hypothetical protein